MPDRRSARTSVVVPPGFVSTGTRVVVVPRGPASTGTSVVVPSATGSDRTPASPSDAAPLGVSTNGPVRVFDIRPRKPSAHCSLLSPGLAADTGPPRPSEVAIHGVQYPSPSKIGFPA